MRCQNLFINSYNKTATDTNYNYNISIPEYDIQTKDNEQMSLTITNFNTQNIFYNINDSNNKFSITINKNGVITTATMTIPIGIYDVYTLTSAIDLLIVDETHCTYIPLLNKINFIGKNNNTTITINFYSNLYKILNLPSSNRIITFTKTSSVDSGLVNMNRFNYILIYITGITCYNPNISNISTNNFKLSNLVAIINRADVLPFGNICYVELNENNRILLGNNKISNLNIKITDEYGNLLEDLEDWTMTIKFVINSNNKNNKNKIK